MEYIKPKTIDLKAHPVLNEKWVQERIAEDPSILGLGEDLILKDKERKQRSAGRLDLLLQDSEYRRYEVEIQLGKVDESHIIRTIEYWDIERKRYPQYDHCAVVVAEDITSRFLNVISLLNGHIPIIAIQLNAVQIDNKIALFCTKVLDELPLGLVEEDEEGQEVVDRHYWIERAKQETVEMADKVLELIHDIDTNFNLKYNKPYIGIEKDGVANNFVIFRPRKNSMTMAVRLGKSDELDQKIEEAGLDILEYSKRGKRYRIRLSNNDVSEYREVLSDLLKQAYENANS